MFKLAKIMNSGINVPEIEKIKKKADIKLSEGCLLNIKDGVLDSFESASLPMYITLEAADENYGGEVRCYRVCHGMVFYTRLIGDVEPLKVGVKVDVFTGNGQATDVTSDTANPIAEVVSLCSAKRMGDKIKVKLL